MSILQKYEQVDCHGEHWIKSHYDRIVANTSSEYCLVAIALKNFAECSHRIGHEESVIANEQCFTLLGNCMQDDEYIAHIHTHYYLMLIKSPPVEETIHKRAHDFHYAVRDILEVKFGFKLFLEMGFFPIINANIDFYRAQYLADLCRLNTQRDFPETNYDIYYLSYDDPIANFCQYESMVQSAIDKGHFELFLQPKVNLRTGEVTSAEALMRWNDPKLGYIPLSSFLAGIENNGAIREVDLYLFSKACSFMERWLHKFGKEISISFNMSKAYFSGVYFMPEYTAVFETYDILPKMVRIELLESIVLNDIEKLSSHVKQIYDYGFTCALDDFGSGFSSFDVLTNVDLSELKIDRALFQNASNPKEKQVIKHIVDMAHSLNMIVVAEGVENEAYDKYLKEIGCDFIQGFYYYKPMPVEEFERLFILNENA